MFWMHLARSRSGSKLTARFQKKSFLTFANNLRFFNSAGESQNGQR